MRCGCPDCGAYMIHSEGLAIACVCPECGRRCNMCLGTNSVVSREALDAMRHMTRPAGDAEEAQREERFSVRRAQREDVSRALDVIRAGFATVAWEFGLTEDKVPSHPAFLKMEALAAEFDAGNACFCAETDGEMVGFAEVARQGDGFEIRKLAVAPAHRRQGCGGALLAAAEAYVASCGGGTIRVGIIQKHVRLREWYETRGYRHDGTQEFPHLPFVVGYLSREVEGK